MEQKWKIAGGEIFWSLLYKVDEKDRENKAHFRAAPKLSTKVLYPGNYKQSVPVVLAIFDPSTRAAILKYFPNAQDSADFRHLISTWWTISQMLDFGSIIAIRLKTPQPLELGSQNS